MTGISDSAYSVGYRKPPHHTQFKPGQSGNVHGRPKKTLTVADVLKKELLAPATIIKKNGRAKKISMLEAMLKRLVILAAEGDTKATAMLLKLLTLLELDEENKITELLQTFRAKDAQYDVAAETLTGTREVYDSTGNTVGLDGQNGSV